jgi:hypothetical protein
MPQLAEGALPDGVSEIAVSFGADEVVDGNRHASHCFSGGLPVCIVGVSQYVQPALERIGADDNA